MAELDHIGIAVLANSPLAQALQILGLPITGKEAVPEEQVEVEWIALPKKAAHIELLHSTADDGPVAKFLAKNKRDGIHHLSFLVEDIKATTKKLQDSGFAMIYPEPRKGAANKLVNFVHPKSTGGILLELGQLPKQKTP